MNASPPPHDEKKRNKEVSFERGLQFTIKHPKHAAALLSRAFDTETRYHIKFGPEMRLSLARHLMDYVANPDFERDFDEKTIKKIKQYPLSKTIRLAIRYPKRGIQMLAVMLYDELKNVQQLPDVEVISFVSSLLDYALEEFKEREG